MRLVKLYAVLNIYITFIIPNGVIYLCIITAPESCVITKLYLHYIELKKNPDSEVMELDSVNLHII